MNAVQSLSNANLQVSLQHRVLQEWSRHNPEEAVNWVISQPPSQHRSGLMGIALHALAQSDVQSALEFASTLSGQERFDAIVNVLPVWTSYDPRAAAAWIDGMTEPRLRQTALMTVASAYAQQQPEEALQWLISLSPRDASMASGFVFSTLAQADPKRASELVATLPEGSGRFDATSQIVAIWAQNEPSAAAQWVESIANDEQRRQLTATLLQQWASHDQAAAMAYLDRIPTRAERDAAAVAIIGSLYHDPRFAEELFGTLRDPGHRRLAAQRLYFMFSEIDPQRAEQYRSAGGIRD
jgi:hypothetical protein